ncbi:hypothetical protein F5I97DRAFT_202 [Phlebopus sp. FC_14]|nr:hypothetical protein F5I97DRAFT_202 [Phlebopus sp. FC_14]
MHMPPHYFGPSQNNSLGAGDAYSAEPSIQSPRRFLRPVIPPAPGHSHGPHRVQHHMAFPPSHWLEMQRERHDHVPHPVHSHAHTHVRPLYHVHPPHIHHFHPTPGSQPSFHPPSVPVPSMFSRSRTHGQASDSSRAPGDLGMRRPSLTTSSGSASEQLIVPRAPTTEVPDQASRNVPAIDRFLFSDIQGRTTRPPAAVSGGGSTSMADGTRGSFTIAPSSSVTFSGTSNGGAPTMTPSSNRNNMPTFVISNSSGNPVVVTNRVSNGHGRSFTTSLDVEPADLSQHPASSARPGPAMFSWDSDARGRVHPRPNSRENVDPTSGNADSWWLT